MGNGEDPLAWLSYASHDTWSKRFSHQFDVSALGTVQSYELVATISFSDSITMITSTLSILAFPPHASPVEIFGVPLAHRNARDREDPLLPCGSPLRPVPAVGAGFPRKPRKQAADRRIKDCGVPASRRRPLGGERRRLALEVQNAFRHSSKFAAVDAIGVTAFRDQVQVVFKVDAPSPEHHIVGTVGTVWFVDLITRLDGLAAHQHKLILRVERPLGVELAFDLGVGEIGNAETVCRFCM